MNGLEFRCGCGHQAPLESKECAHFLRGGTLECRNCEKRFPSKCPECKMEEVLPCELAHAYPTVEEEVWCITLNALFHQGVAAWNCRPEPGKCPDYVTEAIKGVPFHIKVGDIPFMVETKFGVLEIKYHSLLCYEDKKMEVFYVRGSPVELTQGQHRLMESGTGLLLLIAEPTPKFLGLKPIVAGTKPECGGQLRRRVRRRLAQNVFKYRGTLIDRADYMVLGERLSAIKRLREDPDLVQAGFTYGKVMEIMPEREFAFTLEELWDGSVIVPRTLEAFRRSGK